MKRVPVDSPTPMWIWEAQIGFNGIKNKKEDMKLRVEWLWLELGLGMESITKIRCTHL